jgi:hypothetical protein
MEGRGSNMTRIRLDYVHEYRDRHGRLRRYFRRPGFTRIPLRGIPGSDEFMAAYQLALAGQPQRTEIGASRTKPGTVNAAIVGYYTSLVYRELADGSQRKYRNVLERFREEHGDKRIALLPRDFIIRALGKKSRYAARNWFKAIRALMKFAAAEGFRADDPTDGIALPALKESAGIHLLDRGRNCSIRNRSCHRHQGAARLCAVALYRTASRRCRQDGAATHTKWRHYSTAAKDRHVIAA